MEMKEKTAIVTGAAGTLCSEIAIRLAKEGAFVILIGRTEEKLNQVAQKILEEGGQCRVEPGDVTDEKRMEEIAAALKEEGKNCDILINGAGGNQNRAVTQNTAFTKTELEKENQESINGFFTMDMGVFENVITVNVLGTVIPSRVFGRQMAQNKGGSILNFASMNSYLPLSRVPAYAISKAGIVNFTEWLAAYLAPAGIRVNAVAPGFFVNERSKKILQTPQGGLTSRGEKVIDHTPAGRFGQAEDLYGCVRFLLDEDAAAFVTGVTVPVDGGFRSVSGV